MTWITRGIIILWFLFAIRVGHLVYTYDGERAIVLAIALRSWVGGLLSAYLLHLFITRNNDKDTT